MKLDKLKEYSDELCRDYGLIVVDGAKGRGLECQNGKSM